MASRRVSLRARTPLLDVLRNHLGLKGTRFGCGLEQCGCCMALIDCKPEKSCARPLWSVAGPTAAAIGNAAAHALGARPRDLPLTRERMVAALLAE